MSQDQGRTHPTFIGDQQFAIPKPEIGSENVLNTSFQSMYVFMLCRPQISCSVFTQAATTKSMRSWDAEYAIPFLITKAIVVTPETLAPLCSARIRGIVHWPQL